MLRTTLYIQCCATGRNAAFSFIQLAEGRVGNSAGSGALYIEGPNKRIALLEKCT